MSRPLAEATGRNESENASEPLPEAHTHPHRSPHLPPPPSNVEFSGDGLLPALQSLISVLVIAVFFTTFCVQPVRIPSSSMEPTLLVGDFLLLDKQPMIGRAGGLLPPGTIHHDDVIVFHDPAGDPAVHLVKRVIGLPGDRIHLRDGVVFRNGEALREPFAVHRPSGPDLYRDDFPDLQTLDLRVNPDWWIALRRLAPDGELIVPPGNYFVLGDNRNDSEDSRYWGFVPRAAIVGEPVLIYFSWRRKDDPGSTTTVHPLPTLFDFARWDRTFRVIH